MGNAIMSFYSALIDLLGRCAPEMHVCGPKAFLQLSLQMDDVHHMRLIHSVVFIWERGHKERLDRKLGQTCCLHCLKYTRAE